MKKPYAITTLTATMLLAVCATHVNAEELLRRTAQQQIAEKTQTSELDSRLETTGGRLVIDPRTGEVYKTKEPSGDSKPSGDRTPPVTREEPVETAPAPLPYDYFDADDDSDSLLNSYLLSQLSMGVYGVETTEEGFRQELITRFEPQGIAAGNIEVLMHDPTGTELAVFTIGQATVIAFRGTSAEGTTNPEADVDIDLLDVPLKVNLNDKECRIHEGFWISSDAVYDWVLDRAFLAHLDGQRIFLTGHSLGAAKATVTAFRLMYEDGIPVHSLQTFGSPKVGDADFVSMCGNVGPDGIPLAAITQRWVVLGDPATTFPDKEMIGFNLAGPIWVFYEHMGITHNIEPINGDSSEFEILFESGEIFFIPLPHQWYGFLNGLGENEHMWYDDALLEEVTEDPFYDAIAELLLEHADVLQ